MEYSLIYYVGYGFLTPFGLKPFRCEIGLGLRVSKSGSCFCFFYQTQTFLLLFLSWKFGLGLKKVGEITYFGVKYGKGLKKHAHTQTRIF